MSHIPKIKIGVATAVAISLMVFIFANMEVIEVDLLVAKVKMRRSFMVLCVLLGGFIIGWVARSFVRLKSGNSHKTDAE